MRRNREDKVMTAREAVDRFVFDGALVGLGGQNVGRCGMAILMRSSDREKKI